MAELTFIPIPAQAVGDRRLGMTDWRVLAAIALHDRRSLERSGAGCYAGQRTLADVAATDRRSLRRSIENLIAWGYVIRESRADGRRGDILRILERGRSSAPIEDAELGRSSAPAFNGTRDEHSGHQCAQGGRSTAPSVGASERPEVERETEIEEDSSEEGARSRAARGEIVQFPLQGAKAEIPLSKLIERASQLAGSQVQLARRAGVHPQQVTFAKQGRSSQYSPYEILIRLECNRLIKSFEAGESIEPVPSLPRCIERSLPTHFRNGSWSTQLQFVRQAAMRAKMSGDLNGGLSEQAVSWCNWVADRTPFESDRALAEALASEIAESSKLCRL